MKNKFLIPKDHSGIRLHKWLRKQFPSLPLSAVHRSLRTKKVRLNEKRAKGEEVLYEGDVVQLFFDPGGEMLQKSSTPPSPPVPDALLKKNFPVLYEDEEIVAINKPLVFRCTLAAKLPLEEALLSLPMRSTLKISAWRIGSIKTPLESFCLPKMADHSELF
jgi:hypothetical protein